MDVLGIDREFLRLFGDIYVQVKQEMLQTQSIDPARQQQALKETVFTLFPSSREDTSLRIYKSNTTGENTKNTQICVSISPEYERQILRVAPSLDKIKRQHQSFGRVDFWCHVVCAATQQERTSRDGKLGMAAKDDQKEARGLLKDLATQIAFKFSPLQKDLADALSLRVRHKDLLVAHARYSSYVKEEGQEAYQQRATWRKQEYPPEAIRGGEMQENKTLPIPHNATRSYITQPVSIPDVSFVRETPDRVITGCYGQGPEESQFSVTDAGFSILREVNCFSLNLLDSLRGEFPSEYEFESGWVPPQSRQDDREQPHSDSPIETKTVETHPAQDTLLGARLRKMGPQAVPKSLKLSLQPTPAKETMEPMQADFFVKNSGDPEFYSVDAKLENQLFFEEFRKFFQTLHIFHMCLNRLADQYIPEETRSDTTSCTSDAQSIKSVSAKRFQCMEVKMEGGYDVSVQKTQPETRTELEMSEEDFNLQIYNITKWFDDFYSKKGSWANTYSAMYNGQSATNILQQWKRIKSILDKLKAAKK